MSTANITYTNTSNNDIWNFVALIANLSTLNKQTANPTISTPSAIER